MIMSARQDNLLYSEDVLPKVLVLDDRLELLANRLRVDDDALVAAVWELEEGILELRRHHGVQPPSSDVLHACIDRRGDLCNLGDAIWRELERRSVCGDQRGILFRESVLRLRHDANEIRFGEGLQLDTDREPSLKLWDEVGGLGDVEGPGGDEQDVVRLHHPVLRLHV